MSSISLRHALSSMVARSLSDLGQPHGQRRKFVGILDLVFLWQDRAHQRLMLAELDDHLLTDLGLSRSDVERECRKPFWRA